MSEHNRDPASYDYAPMRQWATPRQLESVDSLLQYGSVQAAAEALGIGSKTLQEHLSNLRRRAARQGWSPEHDMTKTVPDGYHVKGVSTYYDRDGNPRGQWVKTNKNQEHRIAALLDALQHIAEPIQGTSGPANYPECPDFDLLCVYPMGDPHIGMFAWAEEAGDDFDLEIAERDLVDAVDKLVGLAPETNEALIINLGDFFHSDTQDNRTSRSGHALDVDTRYAKCLRVGVRIMRRLIDKALEKHDTVTVINEIGNHDDHSAIMLSTCLSLYYENNPRVCIDTSPSTFHWYRFGHNLIGVTHGHNTKPKDLPGIMASERAEDWGQTEQGERMWYTGHIHHQTFHDFNGAGVESFRTLAPRDAWAASKGYRSRRDMKLDIWDRNWGRVQRHTVGIPQLRSERRG